MENDLVAIKENNVALSNDVTASQNVLLSYSSVALLTLIIMCRPNLQLSLGRRN